MIPPQSLRKVADHFDPLQYKELLRAYVTLADHSENLGFEFSSLRLGDVLSSIPEIIVRCVDDMTRQFVRQMFKIGSPRSMSMTASPQQQNNSVGGGEDGSSQSVQKVIQCFERMTDLMHTYYLLVQWHRDPFNPHNDSAEYLHRCGIDDDDDDDDLADDDVDNEENQLHNGVVASPSSSAKSSAKLRRLTSPRHRRTSSGHVEVGGAARAPYTQVLCETGMTLLRYRKIVWENIQQNVLEVLERLDMTYGTPSNGSRCLASARILPCGVSLGD